MSDLDRQLSDAHAKGDLSALVSLYSRAADQAADTQGKRFFLTHAYVFALETGHADAPTLCKRLQDAARH